MWTLANTDGASHSGRDVIFDNSGFQGAQQVGSYHSPMLSYSQISITNHAWETKLIPFKFPGLQIFLNFLFFSPLFSSCFILKVSYNSIRLLGILSSIHPVLLAHGTSCTMKKLLPHFWNESTRGFIKCDVYGCTHAHKHTCISQSCYCLGLRVNANLVFEAIICQKAAKSAPVNSRSY